jgi:hypothetical protein
VIGAGITIVFGLESLCNVDSLGAAIIGLSMSCAELRGSSENFKWQRTDLNWNSDGNVSKPRSGLESSYEKPKWAEKKLTMHIQKHDTIQYLHRVYNDPLIAQGRKNAPVGGLGSNPTVKYGSRPPRDSFPPIPGDVLIADISESLSRPRWPHFGFAYAHGCAAESNPT